MDNRVLLLLTLSTCVALAQNMGSSMGQRCVCRRIRGKFGSPKQIMDIQILPPSHSCDKLEIVVSLKNGLQYCMNPKAENVEKVIRSIIAMKKKATAPSTTTTSTTSSSSNDE
ncbi:alveolar macrophage chemotactic factor-like [Clupea harengus]|uniref:Alveolar macrophage chemotactic factor-like n=1 Tax=Clupea harengus TaxID=7950 RepID=A0A6P8H6I6_CLUHA|nr:alveolar macrophage chemotactic factor-like [Clupea harengus]